MYVRSQSLHWEGNVLKMTWFPPQVQSFLCDTSKNELHWVATLWRSRRFLFVLAMNVWDLGIKVYSVYDILGNCVWLKKKGLLIPTHEKLSQEK